MDKGAHFHRCDFQVHTPRDAQWDGPVPSDDEARRQFAATLIQACRAKGLDAIAITDHHDFAYFQYVKAAADLELDDQGTPVGPEHRIAVFPGMELTLAVPCQALLILDAEFPATMLPTIYTALAIQATDHAKPQCPQAQPLNPITLLSQLHQRLDEHSHLRGRYIILPHLSDGGHKTLLRSQFQAKYIEMPCVGGYLDGSFDKLGEGARKITDGKDRNYGFKKVGVFQTSDNRKADFTNLGVHSTWVKWATPTAEALRQACLARETRISHTPPLLPSLVIEYLEVSNCKFLGPINLEFNTQFNCFIGGRGTGKSTILEYLRWALCDQPPSFDDEDESVSYQTKRATLIEKTLIPHQGIVTVGFLLDDVPHVVRRKSETNEVMLKIGKEEFRPCTEEDVRDLLPIQAYSQKQLSAVGVRTDELVRFIRASIKKQLAEVASKVSDLKARIRSSYGLLKRKRELARELEKDQLELDSLTKRVDALRKQLKGLTKKDQQTLAAHEPLLQEEQCIDQLGRDLNRLQEMTAEFEASVTDMPTPLEQDEKVPNLGLLHKLEVSLKAVFEAAKAKVQELAKLVNETSPHVVHYEQLVTQWKDIFDAHTKEYEQAKQRATSHKSQLTQITEAEERIKAVRTAYAEKRDMLTRFGSPEEEYRKARSEWITYYKTRGDLMAQKCDELTNLSSQRIRASLRRGAGMSAAKDRLLGILSGTKVRTKKVEELCESISASDDPVAEWGTVLAELEQIAVLPRGEGQKADFPEMPTLTKASLSASDLERLAAKLNVEDWLDLSLVELEDIPLFEYRQREGEYIKFSEASAGQQATALLRVLLNQEGSPLVIDQPEEDLDNQVILEIVEEIWKAKRKRQIIFSSHNANIVVNGDADLVICCDYRTAGDHSGGKIKCQGAIDVEEMNKEITMVMEGGKEAFRLRKEKYGF